ncbi:hypothetical protein HUT18_14315 [Streptomyces sp. NA04227]|uniref:hypothetical protein n=1 Tax=Streptomyces sp. NA04227 TaxID=2742136 RepID=UPI0015910800|nr:hypothetical protein [Streptomyces sp. NA04227]QKW07384.1 hypothetical protein HUT18_14315 [Streptomyces sp. NA04227]
MRIYIGNQEVRSDFEFDELAFGVHEVPDDFRELFAGPAHESDEERAVRSQVAREVLAELLEARRGRHAVDTANADYALALSGLAPVKNGADVSAGPWMRTA